MFPTKFGLAKWFLRRSLLKEKFDAGRMDNARCAIP